MEHLINPENTCCFSGHRPTKLPWRYDESDPRCIQLKRNIYEACVEAYNGGIRHFICGMARGCDTYFIEEVFRLKRVYDDITTEAAIPCETQAENWPERDRDRYFSNIENCDFEYMLSTRYTRDCMINRNKYMVNSSSQLIAVFNGTLGGTMQTVNFAEKKGLKIIKIEL